MDVLRRTVGDKKLEILVRRGTAGPQYCMFAAAGDPEQNYAKIVASLKRAPLVITDEESGEEFDALRVEHLDRLR